MQKISFAIKSWSMHLQLACKVWNLVVLKKIGFERLFSKNNRFCRLMVFKITRFPN